MGCATPGEKLLNSPEMRSAMVQMVNQSNKTWEAGADLHNPELAVYYVSGVQVRIIGISGEAEIHGASGPTDEPPNPTAAP